MSDPIVFVGTHRIHEGKLEMAKAASAGLVQFLRENHPRVLHFEIYIDDDSRQMTVIQIHPDEASLLQHMQLAGDKLAQAYEFLDTDMVRIFGRPSETLKSALVGMASSERVSVESPYAGFSRLLAVAV
jgi:CHASE2 domain-containing sensor protein